AEDELPAAQVERELLDGSIRRAALALIHAELAFALQYEGRAGHGLREEGVVQGHADVVAARERPPAHDELADEASARSAASRLGDDRGALDRHRQARWRWQIRHRDGHGIAGEDSVARGVAERVGAELARRVHDRLTLDGQAAERGWSGD